MADTTPFITIEDAQINAALSRVAEAGGETGALMNEIQAAMLFSVQRRFETESAPDGTPWQRHAPRTAKARAKRKTHGRSGGTGPITPKLLRETNRLYKSISGEATKTEASVGTNLVYAAIHQTGGTVTQYPQSRKVKFRKVGTQTLFAKKAHKRAFEKPVTFGERTIVIPARPYLGFSDEDRATILVIAENHYSAITDGGLS
ncbi:phage virion morphogenesis protein [Roseibium sp. CAU 1637]|uniref:Phage virion morphogenesis protein n=1 Tax=Roseibium limicola TaxID=2816037 RepID=A0A939J5P5_9HYPH|nr:phage virion morphogenesis protein [Roseibium limicola]MBO0346040.1 phage virion morphogenesis protein [Roseibium limicola]